MTDLSSKSPSNSSSHCDQFQGKQPLPQNNLGSLQSALKLNAMLKQRLRFENDPMKKINVPLTDSFPPNKKRRYQRRNSKCPSMFMAAMSSVLNTEDLNLAEEEKPQQRSDAEEQQYPHVSKKRRFQRRNSKCPSMFKISDFAFNADACAESDVFNSSSDDPLLVAHELVAQLKLRRQR